MNIQSIIILLIIGAIVVRVLYSMKKSKGKPGHGCSGCCSCCGSSCHSVIKEVKGKK